MQFSFIVHFELVVGEPRATISAPPSPVVAKQVAQENVLVALPPQVPTTTVVFAKSEQQVASDGSKSILELAKQHGVKMRSGCRKGSCGACKQRKVKGEVKYAAEPIGLEENEQETFILPCVAYPWGRVVIDA